MKRLNKSKRIAFAIGGAAFVSITALAMVGVAVHFLPPRLPGREQGIAARIRWYFESGQCKADTHTAVNVVQYILTPEGEVPATSGPTNLAVAGDSAPTPPER